MDVRFATGWQAPDAAVDGSNRLPVYVFEMRREGYDVVLVEEEHS